MDNPRLMPFAVLPMALVMLAASVQHVGAQCSPASCPAVHAYIDFEGLPPGTTVEGLGAVHPLLNLASQAWGYGPSCAPGSAVAIENGNPAFASYGTGASTPNGCLTGNRGFGDATGCVLDYDFTFAPGISVSCFSIRMLDFGDLYPFGTAGHQVDLTAYDAGNNVVDQDQLLTSGGVDLIGGDACASGPNGGPGNHLFTVTGAGIVKVTLRFDASPDPNVGFDDISFCAHADVTPSAPASWGSVKTIYR